MDLRWLQTSGATGSGSGLIKKLKVSSSKPLPSVRLVYGPSWYVLFLFNMNKILCTMHSRLLVWLWIYDVSYPLRESFRLSLPERLLMSKVTNKCLYKGNGCKWIIFMSYLALKKARDQHWIYIRPSYIASYTNYHIK